MNDVTIVYAPKGRNSRQRKVILGKYMDIGESRVVSASVAKTLKSDKDIKIVFSEAYKNALKKAKAAEKAAKDEADKKDAENE